MMPARAKQAIALASALLLEALQSLWLLWYFGRLRTSGALISVTGMMPEAIGPHLLQHVVVLLPMLLVIAAALLLKHGFPVSFGLSLGSRRGRISVLVMAVLYMVLLACGLALSKLSPLVVFYQWLYYLLLVALSEEFTYRAFLPGLMQWSNLSVKWVWIIPGVLFGLSHLPLAILQDGWSLNLLSPLFGYVAYSCLCYYLRRWSGALFLPVLLHAAMDFTGVFL